MKKVFPTKPIRILALLASVALTLALSVPALAGYIGPNRTVTTYYTYWWYPVPGQGGCSVFSPPPEALWNYELACLNFSAAGPCSCEGYNQAYQDNLVQALVGEQTTTYPPATISGALQCSKFGSNGWCISPASVSLAGNEPVAGYSIITIEGTRNGQTFTCIGSSCSVSLLEGNNDFTFWSLSSWGDSSPMETTSGKVDTHLPQISGSLTGVSGDNGWFISDLAVAASAADPLPGSGLASFQYSFDSGAWKTYTNPITISDGSFTLNLQALDRAGNRNSISQAVKVDTILPNLVIDTVLPDGLNGWYIHPPLLTAIADDMTSGLSRVAYQIDGGSWVDASQALIGSDGFHLVAFQAIDVAGNITAAYQIISLDATRPNVAFSMPAVPASGWYTFPVTILVDASDETSGISLAEISVDGGITWQASEILTDGSHFLLARAEDQAGNQASATTNIQVDTQSPIIQFDIAGNAGQNGWHISPLIMTINVIDNGSGVSSIEYRVDGDDWQTGTVIDLDTDGAYLIESRAIDLAGNQSSDLTAIQIDTQSPIIQTFISGETGQNGWYTSPVTMAIDAVDNGSGVALIEYRVDGSVWQSGAVVNLGINGIHAIDVRVIDFAGNEAEESYEAKVDTNQPQVSLNAPGSFCSVCEKVTITYAVRSSTSNIAQWNLVVDDSIVLASGNNEIDESYVWDASNLNLGAHVLTLSARDQAGKTTKINLSVTLLPPPPTSTPIPPTPTSTPVLPTPTSTPVPSVTVVPTPTSSGTKGPSTKSTSTPVPPRTPSTITFGVDTPTNSQTDKLGLAPSSISSGSAPSSALWGGTAAAVLGAISAYSLEQQRKRKEEEFRQLLNAEVQSAQFNAETKQKQAEAMQQKRREEEAARMAALKMQQPVGSKAQTKPVGLPKQLFAAEQATQLDAMRGAILTQSAPSQGKKGLYSQFPASVPNRKGEDISRAKARSTSTETAAAITPIDIKIETPPIVQMIVLADSGLNMRVAPSTNANVVTKIPKGEKVHIDQLVEPVLADGYRWVKASQTIELPPGILQFGSPIDYSNGMQGNYWPGKHVGRDYYSPFSVGVPILASANGIVVDSGTQKGYGNYVIVEYPSSSLSEPIHNLPEYQDGNSGYVIYAHLEKAFVSYNPNNPMKLEAGAPIGIMGSTGNSDMIHLHIELRLGNAGMPNELLTAKGGSSWYNPDALLPIDPVLLFKPIYTSSGWVAMGTESGNEQYLGGLP